MNPDRETQATRVLRNVVPLGDVPRARWLTPEAMPVVEDAEQLPFSFEEYSGRQSRVRDQLTRIGADAIIVFRPSSVEFLCGYHSMETAPQPLLVTGEDVFLYVLDLELGRAIASSCAANICYCDYSRMHRALGAVAAHVSSVMPKNGRLAVETGHVSTPPAMVESLEGEGVSTLDGGFLVERVRLVLSPGEVGFVERAAVLTQQGVQAAISAAREQAATDASVAAAISAALIRDSNSRSAWGPVVATGERGGIAHSNWVLKPLSDDVTFLEFAGTHHRYHAPLMRTLARGKPSQGARRLEALAQAALGAVLEHARPGITCSEVANQALRAIGPLQEDEVFHHMFGYPVGLAHPPHWMDGAPFYITAANDSPLSAGMVFHVPGSFRKFGQLGVGLSQTFVVEEKGARVLTHGVAELINVNDGAA